MRIGQIAQASGFPTKTIRYYEELGLLPEPRREPSGYRSYDAEQLRRLELIRLGKNRRPQPDRDQRHLERERRPGR